MITSNSVNRHLAQKWLYKCLEGFLYIQYLYLFYFKVNFWNYIMTHEVLLMVYRWLYYVITMYEDTILPTSFTKTSCVLKFTKKKPILEYKNESIREKGVLWHTSLHKPPTV